MGVGLYYSIFATKTIVDRIFIVKTMIGALIDKLRQEKSGILNWLIDGSVEARKETVSRSN